MARVQKGLLTGLQLQPGWTVTANDDGTIVGRCVFKCDNAGLVDKLPRKGTPHPKNNKMQAYRSEGTAEELGFGTITVDYLGLTRDPSDPKVSFVGSLNQEPIETHPKFKDELGGDADNQLNGAQYDEDGAFKGFANNEDASKMGLVGVTGYLRPGVIYRSTFYTAKPSNFRLDKMGKIVTSPPGFPQGVPLPSGANWLVGPSALEPFGLIYKISTDYMLSGKDGWNPHIYESAEG